MNLITQKISKEVKKILENLFLLEREFFCEEREDVGSGFYERSLRLYITQGEGKFKEGKKERQ